MALFSDMMDEHAVEIEHLKMRLADKDRGLELLRDENAKLRAAIKIAENAITGHLSMAYGAAESALQLRCARDELRASLNEQLIKDKQNG